jgi:alcohol dehydrogenase
VKAWRLNMAAREFRFEDVPDPVVRRNSVLLRVEASQLVSYQRAYVSGQLTGYFPPPGTFTPGTNAVGVIEEVGEGVYDLQAGMRVVGTGHFVAAENVPDPSQALLGITAEPDSPVLADWPDGTFAERVVVPVSTVTPVPDALRDVRSTELAKLFRYLVPYGGLLRAGLAPGDTVIVNGATGAYGTAGVHVALAMGAARVVAAGRNRRALDALAAYDSRVATVRIAGQSQADAAALRKAAGGPIDSALDMIGGATSADSTLAAFSAVRAAGRIVLMGSASVPIPLDYLQLMRTGKEIVGNFMYPRDAPARLLQLIAAGLLNLADLEMIVWPLAEFDKAMDDVACPERPVVVVQP